MSKKVKLLIPKSYYHKLLDDSNNFFLSMNKICNLIFYKTDILKLKNFKISLKSEENETLSFNLNVKEEIRYNNLADEKNDIFRGNSLIKLTEKQEENLNKIFETDANFFKTVFLNYLSIEISSNREKFIFEEHYKLINEAIKNNKKVKILYKKQYRIIEPYFIKAMENHPYNSIYSYCYKNKGFVTYLLSRIEKLELLNDKWEHYNKKDVESKKINFERYETENKIENILIKINEYGFRRYERESNNRPNDYKKIKKSDIDEIKNKYQLKSINLEENENLYEFKTSIRKIELYFPQFLDNFEILYPSKLRKYFREKFAKALMNHEELNI